jgi:hypothetical protein
VTTKSSICAWGVLYKSGVYAWKVLCLTLGGLPVVCASEVVPRKLSEAQAELSGRQKPAKGIVGCKTEGPNGSLMRGLNGRGSRLLKNVGNASVVQGERRIREKADVGETKEDAPVDGAQLMERVVERGNLLAALKRVRSNGGCPGIDGMSVDALPGYLKSHWPEIKAVLLSGTYQPQAVKRIGLPKPGGGVRELGVPTVLDRFTQQAVLQVLQPVWDRTFSDHSYGFRPKRSAHQAIEQAQRYLCEGYGWVVDLDVEKFFDRVNHDLYDAQGQGARGR